MASTLETHTTTQDPTYIDGAYYSIHDDAEYKVKLPCWCLVLLFFFLHMYIFICVCVYVFVPVCSFIYVVYVCDAVID